MNYHILNADDQGNRFTVVFHVPVADVQNDVSYDYRTAIVEYLGGVEAISSRVPFIDAAELAQMQAGEIYEVVRYYYSNPGKPLLEKQADLDTMYTETVTLAQTRIQNVLGFWGYSRNVT